MTATCSETVSHRERPILFSGAMVRAILEGRKTQTRRVVKWPRCAFMHGRRPLTENSFGDEGLGDGPYLHAFWTGGDYGDDCAAQRVHCPYGVVGDRLWVRETWRQSPSDPDSSEVHYRADPDEPPADGCWKPSIFMRRWASRITLEITGVRIERLHKITEDDAQSEGVERPVLYDPSAELGVRVHPYTGNYRDAFLALWDRINGERAPWASNPFVWVLEFRRIDGKAAAA